MSATSDPRPPSPSEASQPTAAGSSSGASRRRLWTKRIGLGVLALLVALSAGVWFLLGTQSGARWLVERAGTMVPGALDIGTMRGPLRGPLVIENLRWSREGLVVTIDRLFLEWRLRALVERRLDIHELLAERVAVQLAPSEEEEPASSALPDVNLPINIIVRQATVSDLTVSSGGEQIADVRSIDLVTRAIGDVVRIDTFDIDSEDLVLDISGEVVPQGHYPVDLQVDWAFFLPVEQQSAASEATPERQRISGGGTLSGTLQQLQVDQSLRAPLDAQIDATLSTPLSDLSFDARVVLPTTPVRRLMALVPQEEDTGGPPGDAAGLAGDEGPEELDGTAAGTIRAEGTLESLRAQLSFDLDVVEVGEVRIEGDLRRRVESGASGGSEAQNFEIEALRVIDRAGPSRAKLSGSVNLPSEGTPRFDLDLDWKQLVWPLVGESTVSSNVGAASVRGTLEGYDLEASAADVQLVALPDGVRSLGPVQLAARGDSESLRIESLRLEPLGGEAYIEGSVGFAPELRWALAARASALDPTPLLPSDAAFDAAAARESGQESGRVELALQTTGTVTDAGLVGEIQLERSEGVLRGERFAATGRVELDGERIAVDDLLLDWGTRDDGLTLAADGQVAPELGLSYELEVDRLGLLLPGYDGQLQSRGQLRGAAELPRVSATGIVADLRSEELALERVDFGADLDFNSNGSLLLQANASNVRLGTTELMEATLELDGERSEHVLRFRAQGPPALGATSGAESWGASLTSRGGLEVPEGDLAQATWRGELARLDLNGGRVDGWRLASPTSLEVSAAQAALEQGCLVRGSARACVSGRWVAEAGPADSDTVTSSEAGTPLASEDADPASSDQGSWRVALDLTDVPLDLLGPLLPPDVSATGSVSGAAQARSVTDGVLASGTLQPGPGELRYLDSGGATEVVQFAEGDLRFEVDAAGSRVSLQLPLPELGRLAAEISLDGYRLDGAPAEEQPLEGSLRAEISDLTFVAGFADQIADTAGRLDVDITIAGTFGTPVLRGSAELSDGRAELPELGITLTDAQLTASGAESGSGASAPFEIDGSLRSGEGTVRLSGIVPLQPNASQPALVSVEGERFLAMNTREVELWADPDLEIRYDGNRVAVTGEVLVPKADVEIEEPPVSAVEASSDVVFVGTQTRSAEAPTELPFDLRVRVVLGDDVEIAVLGLQAEPEGSLLLVEEGDQPTLATGEIDVSGGQFKAYGQDLTIERGRLFFSGPVDTPRIDLRAYRTAKDGVVAGLEARGSLEEPEITLWSEPPMGQADQLSYLLLGRPIDSASESEGNLVAKAASSLGIKGGNLLVERLAARFGLEEARIESDGGLEEASLVLGKYLSPRLYVAYGVGLFEAANSMRLRYLLSSKWTLEATTGEASGADLLYTIERGRGAKRRLPPIEEIEVPEGPDGAPIGVDEDVPDEDGSR